MNHSEDLSDSAWRSIWSGWQDPERLAKTAEDQQDHRPPTRYYWRSTMLYDVQQKDSRRSGDRRRSRSSSVNVSCTYVYEIIFVHRSFNSSHSQPGTATEQNSQQVWPLVIQHQRGIPDRNMYKNQIDKRNWRTMYVGTKDISDHAIPLITDWTNIDSTSNWIVPSVQHQESAEGAKLARPTTNIRTSRHDVRLMYKRSTSVKIEDWRSHTTCTPDKIAGRTSCTSVWLEAGLRWRSSRFERSAVCCTLYVTTRTSIQLPTNDDMPLYTYRRPPQARSKIFFSFLFSFKDI